MKILMANNYFYLRGGAERVMFNDITALVDRGEEVVPFSVTDAANFPDKYSPRFAHGVEVHATQPLRKFRAAREAIHCGRTAKTFAALLDEVRPDVLHCHNIYGRLTTSILPVARKRGIPAVLTVHDYKVVCPSYLMLRNGKPCHACVDGHYIRCALYRCHKQRAAESAVYSAEAYFARFTNSYGVISQFLCPSRFIAEMLEKSGVNSNRIVYHPNAVELEAAASQPCEGGYVLYVGRLSREKGLPTLMDAMKGMNLTLKVAGTGPLDKELQEQTRESDGSRIVFEGHCEGERLANLYRDAAFVVVPSEWYENAPMAILEAFAYGKPVVASRIGGIPELVTDGETGYLFSWGNVGELKAAIRKLWDNGPARRCMGQNARQLAEARFSQESRTESLMNIYRSLATARTRSI